MVSDESVTRPIPLRRHTMSPFPRWFESLNPDRDVVATICVGADERDRAQDSLEGAGWVFFHQGSDPVMLTGLAFFSMTKSRHPIIPYDLTSDVAREVMTALARGRCTLLGVVVDASQTKSSEFAYEWTLDRPVDPDATNTDDADKPTPRSAPPTITAVEQWSRTVARVAGSRVFTTVPNDPIFARRLWSVHCATLGVPTEPNLREFAVAEGRWWQRILPQHNRTSVLAVSYPRSNE